MRPEEWRPFCSLSFNGSSYTRRVIRIARGLLLFALIALSLISRFSKSISLARQDRVKSSVCRSPVSEAKTITARKRARSPVLTSSNAISSPKVGSSSRFVSEVGRSEISRFARFSGLHPYLAAVCAEPLPFLQLRSVFACWSYTLPAINRPSRPWHLRKGGLSCAASKDDLIENQCAS